MQWGDVPAWVAIAISIVAGTYSWWSSRKAAQASAGAASLEVSLQRIADSLAASAARPPATNTADKRSAELSSAGNPSFNIEFVAGHSYRLRNVGSEEATNVTVTVGAFPVGRTRGLPTGVDLAPMASTDTFVIRGSWQSPAPGEVTVTCEQIAQPLKVLLPPRA
ncbi:MAG: hypothetical protein ABI360_04985 [Allobranchiibius sp.]